MIVFLTLITPILSKFCPINDPFTKYSYGSEWTYSNIHLKNDNCTITSGVYDPIQASKEGLSGLKLKLELPESDTVSFTQTSTYPFAQYQTENIKLRVQTVTNVEVLYVSKFFQFAPPEQLLDNWKNTPTAELQIVFQQDDLYKTCDSEPIYAILAIPIQSLQYYFSGPYLNDTLTKYEDFDFRKNLTLSIDSDTVSYIGYKGRLNVVPCSDTRWFVLTQVMMWKKDNLEKLLARNQFPTTDSYAKRPVQTSQPLDKGSFWYFSDDVLVNKDDTVQWVATWAAAIAPLFFFAVIGCIYGMWRLSNVGRYKRPEEKLQEEQIPVIQDKEVQDHIQ